MCHVLVIEDEFLIATYIQAIVEDNGASSVEVVATEREAVKAALERKPAVITSDLKLSKGSGLKAVQAIHGLAGPIPVIFITATPELCEMKGPHVRLVAKPASESAIKRAFIEIAPI